jgi:hypothetical protein
MRVALVSLLVTWAFFFEYIPPTKRVHVWSDIEGYHYPLLSYAHKSLWQGRVPLWDPSIYCGMPFAGNIQAGLFYPPNWLLFAVNAKMPPHLRGAVQGPTDIGMRYTSVEILAFLHVWLAFLFTYLWLRERTSGWLPAVLGGTVVACGGYMLSQMNHLGVICGYTWMPFALWGIEQANRHGEWAYLWKVAAGSALCLFAGYPPTLAAFGLICVTYAAVLDWRGRLVPLTTAALALSLVIGAVQLLPSMQATQMKQPEVAFGSGMPSGMGTYASMLLPNWFDQNRTASGPEMAAGDYLYLGVPFLFGVLWLLRRGARFRGALPALLLGGVILFIASDPTDLVVRIVERLPVVSDVLRRYNLVAGLVLAAALLAASAVDDFVARVPRISIPTAVPLVWAGLLAAWIIYLLTTDRFLAGLKSVLYPAVLLAMLVSGLYILRSRRQAWIAGALALGVVAEYQAFGTNRRFNAVDGNVDSYSRGDARLGGGSLTGMDNSAYHEMLRHPGYRVAMNTGPHSTDMRHYNLATPQGFDPFLTEQYKATVEQFVPFKTNRLFDVNPLDEKMLRHFGLRYIIVRNETLLCATLEADARFRRLPPGTSYYVVFEYLDAQPAWRFDGSVRLTRWEPEYRSFQVSSPTGGRFVLVEQLFPGWKARIDGRGTPIRRADGAFQGLTVPPGDHTVEYRYEPDAVYAGAAVSLLGLAVLGYVMVRRRRSGSPAHGSAVCRSSWWRRVPTPVKLTS